jgi:hypothetical protein
LFKVSFNVTLSGQADRENYECDQRALHAVMLTLAAFIFQAP